MQSGYVLHEEIVSDNWGNNELSLDCYHERSSYHKISDITVMNDTFNSLFRKTMEELFHFHSMKTFLPTNKEVITIGMFVNYQRTIRGFSNEKSQYPLCP